MKNELESTFRNITDTDRRRIDNARNSRVLDLVSLWHIYHESDPAWAIGKTRDVISLRLQYQ